LALVWGPGTLKKSTKPPKKFEKTLCQKNGSARLNGWFDDVIKEYTNMHKHPLIMYTSTEYPKSKIKMFFFIENYMTSRVFRGF